MKYLVTRELKGSAMTQTLYTGMLRWRAVETFARAAAQPGEIVTLFRGREVLRRSNEVVVLRCHVCHEPIEGDFVPAADAMSGLPTCDLCVNAQRHARRAS